MVGMKTLPDRRTLNGKFSAYCTTCWNAVYCLWIGKEDHGGVCPHGAKTAAECPDAMSRARDSAWLRKALAASPPPGAQE